ncbi:putative transcription factor WD40-like family [Helianthus annuus]|uniref:Transcription factor WD40-like family n=1 Tax=Helianthus annuus TaxID=4232 RepID=A0A9K3HPX1_HELAN|nr:putative transcription factor WD40-like family [Helianthus annuus]KAJ0509639.1 putative transcription factor WD40-like family [Helianthus annuus]KAJ0689562.1 putative transcription factor WD40-like family [Helianthus annuus]KAJ0875358.1 putative kinesin-like protein [Helianthus annuus]
MSLVFRASSVNVNQELQTSLHHLYLFSMDLFSFRLELTMEVFSMNLFIGMELLNRKLLSGFTGTRPLKMKHMSGHLGWVRSVAFSPNNEWFCTGSADRTIKIWDTGSGRLRLTLTGHIEQVRENKVLLKTSPRKMLRDSDHVMELLSVCEGISQKEQGAVHGILETTKAQTVFLEFLQNDHSTQSDEIQQKAHDTFQQKYMDYEPSGNTSVRCDPAVPSKDTIESLRAMPMETLLEEFRENHSFELLEVKDGKITPASQSPLAEIN